MDGELSQDEKRIAQLLNISPERYIRQRAAIAAEHARKAAEAAEAQRKMFEAMVLAIPADKRPAARRRLGLDRTS